MSTITKEWLQQAINDYESVRDELPFGIDDYQGNILAALRIALASLEAEAVAWRNKDSGHCGTVHIQGKSPIDCGYEPLYLAPPAPVSVPDELTFEKIAEITASQGYEYSINECICAASWWNACRASMLHGADGTLTNEGTIPDNTSCKLRDAVEIIRNSGIAIDAEKILAERDALNAPDCWCRTCRPVTISDMRFVVCPECGNKRCPHANDHRNACTGSNEPGQEGSAYPAAPQQEAKNV